MGICQSRSAASDVRDDGAQGTAAAGQVGGSARNSASSAKQPRTASATRVAAAGDAHSADTTPNISSAAAAPSHSEAHGNANARSLTIPELLSPSLALPSDPVALRSLVQQLQHALASREMTLSEKEKELASEKAQRMQSAAGVLNASMRIIADRSQTQSSSTNANSPQQWLERMRQRDSLTGGATASGLGQIQEADTPSSTEHTTAPSTKADANGAVAASADGSSSSAAPAAPVDDSQVLRRELMDVLLAFAATELLGPHTVATSEPAELLQSFAEVISQSSLDDETKLWLTAEYTRGHAQGDEDDGGPSGANARRTRASSARWRAWADTTPQPAARSSMASATTDHRWADAAARAARLASTDSPRLGTISRRAIAACCSGTASCFASPMPPRSPSWKAGSSTCCSTLPRC